MELRQEADQGLVWVSVAAEEGTDINCTILFQGDHGGLPDFPLLEGGWHGRDYRVGKSDPVAYQ